MREFALADTIDAPADRVWRSLIDLDRWPQWNHTMPEGTGDLRPGGALRLRMRGPGGGYRVHRPTVISVTPPSELVLAAPLWHPRLLYMVHSIAVDDLGNGRSQLRHHWTVTGFLAPLLWPVLRRSLASFSTVADDLATWLAAPPPSTGTG